MLHVAVVTLLTLSVWGLYPYEHRNPLASQFPFVVGPGEMQSSAGSCKCRIYGVPRQMRCICDAQPRDELEGDPPNGATQPCKCVQYIDKLKDSVFCHCTGDKYPDIPKSAPASFFEM